MAKFGVVSVYDPTYEFEGWSGGKDTLNDLIKACDDDREEVFNRLYDYLDENGLLDEESNIDETELNDTLWFDRGNIYEYFGLDEYGDLKEDEDEGDEDDEDEETEDSADRRLKRNCDSVRRKPVVQSRRDFKKRRL